MIKLANGFIPALASESVSDLYTPIYTATKDTEINFMQFVNEHTAAIVLNVYIEYNSTQRIRIIPINYSLATSVKIAITDTYFLTEFDRIVCTASVADKVSYVINGTETEAEAV